MGGGAEEGDQVVIGGVPTRPSSASTTGQSNTWDVSIIMILVQTLSTASITYQSDVSAEHTCSLLKPLCKDSFLI